MSKKTVKKVKKGAIWKDEIAQYLRNNPSGLTITDIAKGIDTSRVTVTKYMPELLQEEKVFAKEVGEKYRSIKECTKFLQWYLSRFKRKT